MKKFLSVIICLLMLFFLFVISASAEEDKTPRVRVGFGIYTMIDTEYSEDGREFQKMSETSSMPVIGEKSYICVELSDFDSLSSGKMTISYNASTIKFHGDSEPMDWYYDLNDNSYSVPREYLKAELVQEGNGYCEYEIVADGREFTQTILCDIVIEAISLGSFDFDIVFSDMKDKDGNNIDVEIEKNWIPLNTHTVDEAPDIPAFDMENSLTYGMLHIGSMYDRTADTELAYPMTVGEFIDSVDCGTGYGIVTDNDGKVLDRDDYVPTGAQFRQCYDNALFFTSTLTVIGDVNSDGKVTAADARIILRHSAGIDYIKDSYQRNAANTCQSTEITARDARSVMRYAASIEDCYTEWYRYHCLLNKYSRGLYNTNL